MFCLEHICASNFRILFCHLESGLLVWYK